MEQNVLANYKLYSKNKDWIVVERLLVILGNVYLDHLRACFNKHNDNDNMVFLDPDIAKTC